VLVIEISLISGPSVEVLVGAIFGPNISTPTSFLVHPAIIKIKKI
jgi:hypothetical protein